MHGRAWPARIFSGVTILLPKEAGLTELAEQINGAWQKDCSLFFSVEEVPQEEFDKRLAAGSYTIALAPIPRRRRQRIPDAAAVHGRGRRPDRLVRPHLLSASGRECPADRAAPAVPCWPIVSASCWKGCAVVPLLGQNRRLLVADGITGLVFDPFTPVLDLTDAQKN